MKKTHILSPFWWLLVLVATGISAWAAPITVSNHSFENPALGAGGWTNDLPASGGANDPQWIGRDGPNSGDTFIEFIGGFVAEGNQHLGMAGGYYVFQNLGVPYEANTTYTLTVGVGYRNPNQSGTSSLSIIGLTAQDEDPSDSNALPGTDANDQVDTDSLLASASTTVDSVPLNDATTGFTDVTAELTTGDTPPAGNIVIFLGDDMGGARSHFDNVRLEAVTALDPDGDGIPAEWETGTDRGVARNLDPEVDDGGEDPDGDTLTNFQEFQLGTHPRLADTDGDGLNDNFETTTDPLNPDVDGDTLLDGAEIATYQTDPNDTDTDDDDFEDQAEVAAGTDPLDPNSKPARGNAILLGANFIGGNATSDGASVTATAGVVPQDNWNNLPGGAGAPVIANDSAGEPSLMRVSWRTNGPGVAGDEPGAGDGDAQLMFGLLLPRGNGEGGDDVITEITVRNIAYPFYDLYVYFNAEGGGGTYTVNDQTFEVPEVTPFEGSFAEVTEDGGTGNYLHLVGLSGSTLTITGGQIDAGGGIAGFQIERIEPGDPSLLAIPNGVDFGSFDGNPGPQEHVIRVINAGGSQTLNISNAAITGDNAANFAFTAPPATLGPNVGADVSVTFTPSDTVGIYRATLELSSNDVDVAITRIPLIGQIKHANKLLAHFPMDETEGTVMEDSSGNGFHGNYVAGSGSVTLGAPALASGTAVALSEGGDAAYAEIPATSAFPTLAEGSYSFWFRQDPADVGTASVLFSRSSSPANPYAVFFEASGGPDAVTWTSEASSETLISEPFVVPDETYHVVYTYSDANADGVADVAVYVNGELNASAAGTSGYPINTVAPFQIGGTAGQFGLTGTFDDFQIYEVVLTPEQISAMFADPGSRAPVVEPPNPLVAYWALDDGEGTEVAELENPALTGTVNSGTWVAGHTGGAGDSAVELTGEAGGGSNVEFPALNTSFTEITVSGWIKGVPTGDWTGLIQSRDAAQPIGMGVRAGTGELTYTWNDNNGNTYNFVSGLAIPADEWTFIALTVTPTEGRLYLGSDGTLNSAVNAIAHLEQGSPTVWHLGKDNCCGDARNFQGAIDDVAIFNKALSDAQIQSLFDGTSPAALFGAPPGPNPRAGAVAQSDGSLTESVVVDFGALTGDASYEFSFLAVKGGASTAMAGNDAWALKLDQWNEQGVFGTTQFGVADNVFTPLDGQGVASVFDQDVHVVIVNDTAGGETKLYINGTQAGAWAGNFELAGEVRVMGARIAAPVDLMAEGSVLYGWATYNNALDAAEVAALANTPFEDAGTGGGAPDITGISRSAAGVSLQFPAGTTYDIEYSTDLATWEVIATGISGSYDDADATRSANPAGYYRGVVQ